VPNLSGKPRASLLYSDLAILTMATVKAKNLRSVRKHGRKRWKQGFGYHRRSIAETTIFCLKTILGGNLSARKFDSQPVELFIKCAVLNCMIQIAKPDSYKVEA
jgi:hypothetical protein